ncbi:MAG: valine--tRNA ligase [Alphaproteobacteria bacterium]|nr:valine--tRNA ligase [Alphaproteobacteria bacterium]
MLDKTFDPKLVEKRHYPKWEQSGAFAANPERNTTPYTIMIPPPNVTGSLHMGHALNMTLQDVLTRYHRMKGQDALWMPGTDHAGIATQMVVERKLAAEGQPSRREMGRQEFLNKVWEWKAESGNTITTQLRRLGATPDWARERFTMDEGLSKAVRRVFVQLHKDKLIYRDKRLVNWDPKLHTAISDLEVESKDTKGHMWYINYPIEGQTERFITIATTRPETMLGDVAICVNPDDERYKDLHGKFAILPIVGRPIKIIPDSYVDAEAGSGAMKVTPAHDFNDFEIGKRHNLEMINIFDINAHVNENAPAEYRGLDRFDARKKILAELEAQDLLVKVDNISHSVPYGDRSGVVVEPMLSDQWYCDAPKLAVEAVKAVEDGRTEFVPKQWENTYYAWMRNIEPWCISRQLWWGHQIPAWYGPEGSIYVAETEEEALAEAKKQWGDDVRIEQDEDVLDTWFSSALWPFSTLGWPDETKELKRYYPGDVLVTGFDIIFFWVARMMMMGLYFMKDVPFRKVYIHALVRDAKGQKMSKSKGNIIDPLELIDQYGADALRFTMIAMAAQGRDIRLSTDRVEGYRNFATKLWNASRYCQMNGCHPRVDYKPESAKHPVNQWVIGKIMDAKADVEAALAAYKFNDAATALYQFVWNTFCDWYLEFTKPLLGEGNSDDALKQETRDTTAWILDQVLTILNPFMPYITEELHESLGVRDGKMLLTSEWPVYADSLKNKASIEEIEWLCTLVSTVRSLRADMNVPASAKINLQVKEENAQTQERLKRHEEVLLRLARLEKVEAVSGFGKGAVQMLVGEATYALPLADIIDVSKERERLQKEVERLKNEISKIHAKMANKEFVEKAPEEIIAEQKTRLADFEQAQQKFSAALSQLAA